MPAPASDPSPPGETFEVTAAARPESLDAVQDLVERMRAAEPGEALLHDWIRFETAIVEVVGNIVEHSRPVPPAHEVTMHVTLARHGTDLVAEIGDDAGAAAVDLDVPMPDLDSVGGRGIALARALDVGIEHRRTAHANVWTVRCRCAS